ncbi:lamin tail domain-containing protein [Polaribacter litorisediminis]|uniref:lamin tail domain-containing protein n=1 Tax=Polaribacter litorisediminis TaxID=1908341 RepID=UPI001CBE5B6D|nr:lamin tail domain-containing protein [Polaribacter litorisediminis]UAM97301.1 lamin tail domain-containing protein [Polaribacter litorisediminis]
MIHPNFKIKYITLLLILFFNVFSSFAQNDVSINEMMSSNGVTVADEDGDFNDWIEIYNYGSTPINLFGYGLSDDVTEPFKWVFPTVTIQPKSFLLVWASGKNRINASLPLHTSFKISAGGEELVLTKANGTKLSEVPALALERDTSYGRSVDGNGSLEVFGAPTPNASNTGTIPVATEKISINEFMTANEDTNADNDGDFEDWIEIYNYGTTTINLAEFGLSNDRDDLFKWKFPATILLPNQYILVWASGKNRAAPGQQLHTNFNISSGNDILFLTNKNGALVSGTPVVYLEPGVSYGKQPDGTGSWVYFDEPTPGSSNITAGSNTLIKPPAFSHKSGLHASAFDLTLTSENLNSVIIYTLDGSEPDINNLSGTSFNYKNEYPFEIGESFGPLLSETFTSKTYSAPIRIVDRSNDPDKLANKNTVQRPLHTPPNPVRKATVVKARTFVNGVGSKTSSKTFFVWSGGNPYNLPVVSLQTNEKHLFDYNDGIYTAGVDFDTWRTENPTNNQSWRPEFNNYWRSGATWEYPINVQFFDVSLSSVMNADAGFRIHGNNSRQDIIKNLRLYARDSYGENDFDHDLFKQQIPGAPNVYNDNFKRLLLRGNGAGGEVAYDVVFSRLMQPIFNGVTRIEAAVHFFNGEFWGITALRDRMDRFHFANNFDLDEDNIVIVDCKVGKCEIDEGDDTDYASYEDFRDFIIENNMATPANYTQVEKLLDIDSFINHVLLSIFAEDDSYEIKYWKARTKVNDGFGDGKWRLTTQDFEAALKSDDANWLEKHADEEEGRDNSINSSLMGHLLDNEEFKFKFINRFADVLNTAFKEARFKSVVNETFDEISPILEEDENRAPRLEFYENEDKEALLKWIEKRPDELKGQINTLFGFTNTVGLELNVSDDQAGHIKINTIDINASTVGVDENPYPWTGDYFNGVPITLEAKAKPGYSFSNWSGDVSSTNSVITVTPTSNMQIQANYDVIDDFSHLAYFWLFDRNIPNDTPLETVNSTYSRNNLTAELVYTSSLSGYPFTSTNPNWRKASLERKNAPTSINYSAFANNDTPYNSIVMRGLQVKQPFRSGSLENTIQLNLATTNFKEIKVSFAINSDGAAQSLIVDYWNGSNWIATNISYSPTITAQYEKKEIDFSNVALANNNPNFKVRIRFGGANMTADDGKVVLLNNIAVEGIETALSTETFDAMQDLKVFPNPTNDQIKIHASQVIDAVSIYNVFGKLVYRDATDSSNLLIDMSTFSSGVYLVKISSNNKTMNRKIIKK